MHALENNSDFFSRYFSSVIVGMNGMVETVFTTQLNIFPLLHNLTKLEVDWK